MPTQPSGTSAPIRAASASVPARLPERSAKASAASAIRPAQTSGAAGRAALSSRRQVTDPSVVRTGASTPFSVAWATTAKTTSTSAARRLPDPVSTVSRETQPRVSTMPAPKSRPPATMARTGRSAAMKR